jgi:AraC family transcriptional regulator of adaptative response/methylated-DNA-[protein]-cysteine methyltransferase
MTLTNPTSPSVTADAILVEQATGPMPVAHTNSTKPISLQSGDAQPNDEQCWNAVVARDPGHDGEFVFAVATTGVYCRPSCPARRPRRENVTFYSRPEQAEKAGFRACLRCRPRSFSGNPQSDSAKEICRYIDSCRLRLLKRNLQAGDNVTRAMYDAGYGSSSRLYEKTASQLGMTPDKYRRGAIAASIRYACTDSPLGRMLIAATDRGVCAIQFARSDSELIEGLKREFPFAVRKPDDGGLHAWVAALLSKMTGRELNAALPLDIRATAFQRRVWTYLQSIPFGATRSYGQVAKAIGQPSASRAVARACATNPVAVAIPCHRVVREDGSISGYRWGVERKKALLEMEQVTPS